MITILLLAAAAALCWYLPVDAEIITDHCIIQVLPSLVIERRRCDVCDREHYSLTIGWLCWAILLSV